MRALIVLLLAVSGLAVAQTTPKTGTPERKALMDALRAPVEKSLKQKVIFQVDHLKVLGNWAFMTGKPRTPEGAAIDYKKTGYKEAIDAGAFDDWVCALYKKSNGKWKVVQWVLGATDVAWEGWDKQYGAPKSIFPGPQ